MNKFLNFFKCLGFTKQETYWFKGFGYNNDYDNELIFLQTIGVKAKTFAVAQAKAIAELRKYHPKIKHIFVKHYQVDGYSDFFKKEIKDNKKPPKGPTLSPFSINLKNI